MQAAAPPPLIGASPPLPKEPVPPETGYLDLRFTNVTSLAGKTTKILATSKGGAHFVTETKHGPTDIPHQARLDAAILTAQSFPCDFLFGPPVKEDLRKGGSGGMATALGPPTKGNAILFNPAP